MSAELFLGFGSPSGSSWPPEPPSRASGSGSELKGDHEDLPRSDKACKQCRSRKVKCDKIFPVCQRCNERSETCDYGNMVPAKAMTAEGATRIATLQSRLDAVEQELKDIKLSTDFSAKNLPETIRRAFLANMPSKEIIEKFLGELTKQSAHSPNDHPQTVRAQDIETATSATTAVQELLSPVAKKRRLSISSSASSAPSEESMNWWLGKRAMARVLTVHLVETFFRSCCAYLPPFEPWSGRISSMLEHLEDLSPCERIAVTGFSLLGARGSPHSSLLGIDMKPGAGVTESAFEAGRRRETAFRSLHKNALSAAYSLALFAEPSIDNVQALLVQMQAFLFDELTPRHSKAFLAIAWVQYKDLLDDPYMSPVQRQETALRLGYALFLADANIAAYSKRTPLIPAEAIPLYFSDINLRVPDIANESLSESIEALINIPEGTWATHHMLLEASTRVHCWLAAVQRRLGVVASRRNMTRDQLIGEAYQLWRALDILHDSARRIQQFLITLTYTPVDCHKDGCQDLHLRFVTRVDRDGQDVVYLLHGILTKHFHYNPLIDPTGGQSEVLVESENRIRRALKLTTFYMQLYVTSLDRHMTYHLTWQLELIPQWPSLIVQRVGQAGGPANEELEVTDTELDWLEGGLKVAAFYHPVGEKRLRELQGLRRSRGSSYVDVSGQHIGPSGRMLSRRERLE